MFHPWIGSKYDATRLLILGESAYSWWEHDEERHPSPQHSTRMVKWTVDTFPNCGRFFTMLTRALANEQNPTQDRARSVWDRIAFTNYVSGTVGEGSRVRPTAEMWAAAKQDFLPQVSKLNPRRIIILGTTMWGKMPDANIYITDEVQGYRNGDNIMMCCAVSHPAGGLSWRKLASVIQFTYERELAD